MRRYPQADMIQATLSFLVGCSLVSICQTSIYWDCRRSGQRCQNEPECNYNTGQCECPNNRQGFDCRVPKPASACTRTCLNGATCDGATCHCTPDWTGDICATGRATCTCAADNRMNMTVRPLGDFNGAILVRGQAASDCQFTQDDDGVYFLSAPFDPTTVGCGTAGSATDNSSIPYRYFTVEVYFIENLRTYVDFSLEFRCNERRETSVATLSTGPIRIINTIPQIQQDDPITGATLIVRPVKDMPITAPVEVGDIYTFTFFINIGRQYGDILLVIMSVTNPLTDRTREMVRNGCPLISATQFMKGLSKNGTEIQVPVSMFKFVETDELRFDMVVKVCTKKCRSATCTDTNLYVTSEGYGSVGRRRRRRETNADEGETAQVPFQVNVTLGEPLNPDINNDGKVDEKDIITTTPGDGGNDNTGNGKDNGVASATYSKYWIPMTVMFATLLVVAACLLFLCLAFRRRRKKEEDKQSFDSLKIFKPNFY